MQENESSIGEATSINSEKEYTRFCLVLQKERPVTWALIGILEIFMIYYAVTFIRDGVLRPGLIYIALVIAIPFIMFFNMKRQIKKGWESCQETHDLETTYTFYKDHIEGMDRLGKSMIENKKLTRVIETKTAYYLMFSDTQGINIEKAQCTKKLKRHIEGLKIRADGKQRGLKKRS